MSEVYILNITDEIQEEKYMTLFNLMPDYRKREIGKVHNKQNAKCALYAVVLVQYIVANISSLQKKRASIAFNSYGKPYLAEEENYKFNISHSGDWVICGWSSKEIGVDIEQVKKIDINIAQHLFSEYEYTYLNEKNKDKQEEAFFELWTLKESYIKYKGKGLSIPLNEFGFRILGETIKLDSSDIIKPYFFMLKIAPHYKASVCSEEMEQPKIIKITPNQIWNTLCNKTNGE